MFVQKLFERKSGNTLLYFATGRRVNGVTQKKYVQNKDGNYTDYTAYIECSFDTGKSVKYVYYQNSLTDDVDNYWQCPVPKDKRRTAKGDIITVLKDAGFFADFEIIEKFKAKNLKLLILNL